MGEIKRAKKEKEFSQTKNKDNYILLEGERIFDY